LHRAITLQVAMSFILEDKRVKVPRTRVVSDEMMNRNETLNEVRSKHISDVKWSGKH
jgi:hypothetical protein